MKTKWLLFVISFFCVVLVAKAQEQGKNRKQWLSYLDKIARPVLTNLAANTLKEKMPLVLSEKADNKTVRSKVAFLEAFARTLSGIAPWLQQEEGDDNEKKLRNEYRQLAVKALSNATDPNAKDYLQWSGGQPLAGTFCPVHIFTDVQGASGLLQKSSVGGKPNGKNISEHRYKLPVLI